MSEKHFRYVPKTTPGGQLADAMPDRTPAKSADLRPWAIGALALGGIAVIASFITALPPLVRLMGYALTALAPLLLLAHLYLKPVKVTLQNGHSVMQRRSRGLIVAAILVPTVLLALKVTKFDWSMLQRNAKELKVILAQIFEPSWDYFPKVLPPLIDTIKMSVMGSFIGCTLALPFAVLSSSNINHKKAVIAVLRVVLNVVRTLPTLVIASICALIFGLGTFAGTVAITIFTFGIVSKMLYEAIETIDMGAFEAMESMGATKAEAFAAAVMPQILPTYLSQCLYSFEINIRAASILGMVGAGGLGILINERVGWRDYNGLGMVLLCLFVSVFIIENLSAYLRSKLS